LSLLPFLAGGGELPGEEPAAPPYVLVLGIAQDGGFPQAGCRRPDACERVRRGELPGARVSSLGLVDPGSGRRWLFDATPDLPSQLEDLAAAAPARRRPLPEGIFLTHAHVGHYLGLAHLGHEIIGASGVPVWAMPRMRLFLAENGPWSQLVAFGNLELRPLAAEEEVRLSPDLTVTPLLVPHRDEFSETVAFRIRGPRRTALYLPDIDKWERWQRRIEEVLAGVDVAYLDGTFYADGEVPGRDMSEILHPFITETLERLAALPAAERARVRFIHLNHTNPALLADGAARRRIAAAGFGVAVEGEPFEL
jgi:pyrroloquinoline quinone biosynthesis protein B